MSWLNLNESLNNIKGQISSFASGVLADGNVNDADPFAELSAAKQTIDELQNLCATLNVENASLRRQNAEYYEKISFGDKTKTETHSTNELNNGGDNWFWDPPSTDPHAHETTKSLDSQRENTTNSTISELNKIISDLESEKNDLIQSLEQLDLDCQKTTDKLITLKDQLQFDYNNLRKDYEVLQNENGKLKTEVDELSRLQNETCKLKTEVEESSRLNLEQSVEENLKRDLTQLQTEYNKLKLQFDELKLFKTASSNNLLEDYKKLEDFHNDLKTKYDQLLTDKSQLHQKYVNILTETVQKYVDYSIPNNLHQPTDENSETSEFHSKIEIVLKLLLDFKWKTETLERKLCEISHEKNVAITEKNHEIEKLLNNSEILSQEVITKTQTIQHYEMECSELIKNNDLLIAELQQYKANTGLQTISESNEDNLLLLETQLDNANKRVRELELAIGELENAKQDVALETQTELDYIKKQLNLTGNELTQSKHENTELQKLLEGCKTEKEQYLNEKRELEMVVDKLKLEIENAEYKYTEMNVDVETAREDLAIAKKQIAELTNDKEILEANKTNLESKLRIVQEDFQITQSQELLHTKEVFEDTKRDMENKLQTVQEDLQHTKNSFEELSHDKEVLETTNHQLRNELQLARDELERANQKHSQSQFEDKEILEVLSHQLQNKLQLSLEELDYTKSQLSEFQNKSQSLCDELESTKQQLKELLRDKFILEDANRNLTHEIKSAKSEIESSTRDKTLLEQQVITFTQKLQNSKMSETGLKLQNDTIKKEMDEMRIGLEDKVRKLDDQLLQVGSALNQLIPVDFWNLTATDKILFLKEQLGKMEQLSEEEATKFNELQTQNVDLLAKVLKFETQIVDDASARKQEEHNLNMPLSEVKLAEHLDLKKENDNLCSNMDQLRLKIGELESELYNLHKSNSELVDSLKAKHQENVQYHTEIQRLNQIILSENEKYKQLHSSENVQYMAEIQRLNQIIINENEKYKQLQSSQIDPSLICEQNRFLKENCEKFQEQNGFLQEKCEKLSHALLDEQSHTQKLTAEHNSDLEREQSLRKELERLRFHLVEIEDSYTQELLQAVQKNQEMLAKMNAIEQRERDSSTIYTSVSIRANQQVETLQNQLQLVTVQRDELQRKMSDAEDKSLRQLAALTNLQCVLEQFQKDRENDIMVETERIRRQIGVEKQKQMELQGEINNLKTQLEESKQGLKAAARLTEQMEKSKQQVVTMKDEVTKLQDQLTKTEDKYKQLLTQTDTKVDKTLIRNLIVGLISSNNNLNKDQQQVLKIIATVLDFTQHDTEKVALNKSSGSWLNAILHPNSPANANLSQQSLTEAFVRFLETESQPKPAPPSLMHVRKISTDSNASAQNETRQMPLLLNDVLPTFADFAQNRNASSILKDVLKEN